jgi:hypothetical protein
MNSIDVYWSCFKFDLSTYDWSGPCQPVSGWGGVFQKLGSLPFQGPPKIGWGGDWGENLSSRNLSQNNFFPEISKIFSDEILHFLKILQFQHARAPSPQVGPPVLPPPPPRWHGPVIDDFVHTIFFRYYWMYWGNRHMPWQCYMYWYWRFV